MNISRSSFYQWKKTTPGKRAKENHQLEEKIEEIFQLNQGRYGSPRVTQSLLQKGVECSENRVAKLMRRNGLRARLKRPFRPKTTTSDGSVANAHLIKTIEPTAPDQIWVSDITYIPTAQGWLYLAVILDLFTRKIVGWKIAESLEAQLVVDALHNALVQRDPQSGLYFHSDRGSQYTSAALRKPLQVIGAIQSMSAKGNCYDNAKAEAFFSTLKTECLPHNQVFVSKDQARREIFEYIEIYYNHLRLHSRLDYQSPHQFEISYQQKKKTTFSFEKVLDNPLQNA
jgi:putative transposase